LWDLRYDAPWTAADRRGTDDEENQYRFAGGPYVVPGDYVVTVHAAGKDLTKTVKVDMDPRVPVTAADLQAQLDAALTLREMTSRINMTVAQAGSLIRQLTALQDRLKHAPVRTTTNENQGHGGDGVQPPGGRGDLQSAVT